MEAHWQLTVKQPGSVESGDTGSVTETETVTVTETETETADSEPLFIRKRRYWLKDVVNFVQHRIALSAQWRKVSTNAIETMDTASGTDKSLSSPPSSPSHRNLAVGSHINSQRSLGSAAPAITTAGSLKRTDSILAHSAFDTQKQCILRQETVTTVKSLFQQAAVAKPQFDDFLMQQVAYLNASPTPTTKREQIELLRQGTRIVPIRISPAHADGWLWWMQRHTTDYSHGALITMPHKSAERVAMKIKENYLDVEPGPPVSYICDIVRASIICVDEQHILAMVKHLKSTQSVVKIKNRFQNPTANGYRDLLVYIAIPLDDENKSSSSEQSSSKPTVAIPQYSSTWSANGGCKFICELQIHHLDILKLSIHLNSYQYYENYRLFFGVSPSNPQDLANRLKVLRKMDQIGDNVHQLEAFMEPYLVGTGRISRNLMQLDIFYDLFLRSEEYELAEQVQYHIIRQYRQRQERQALSKALGKLAMQFIRVRRYADALPLCLEALAICEDIFGDVHLVTSQRLFLLGGLFYCQGKFEEALPIYQRLVASLQTLKGPSSPEYFENMTLLGELYEDLSDWTGAKSVYSSLLESFRLAGILHSIDSSQVIMQLAFVEGVLGDHETAIEHYELAMQIYKDFYGEIGTSKDGDLMMSKCMEELGELFDRRNQIHRAIDYYEAAMVIRERVLDRNDVKLAAIYNHVAELYVEYGKLGEAEILLEKGLAMCEYHLALEEAYRQEIDTGRKYDKFSLIDYTGMCLALNIQYYDARSESANYLSPANDRDHDTANSDRIGNDAKDMPAVMTQAGNLLTYASIQNNLSELLLARGPAALPRVQLLLTRADTIRRKYLGADDFATKQTANNFDVLFELQQLYVLQKQVLEDNKVQHLQEETVRKEQEGNEKLKEEFDGSSTSGISSTTTILPEAPPNGNTIDASIQMPQWPQSETSTNVEINHGTDASQIVNMGASSADQEAMQSAGLVVENDSFSGDIVVKSPWDTRAKQQIHPDIHKAYIFVAEGDELRDLGEFQKALLKYTAAENIFKSIKLPQESIAYISFMTTLAMFYEDRNLLLEAEKYFRLVCDLTSNFYGSRYLHPDKAQALWNMGSLLLKQEQYEQAIEFLSKSQSMWMALHDGSDRNTQSASINLALGQCYHGLHQLQTAKEYIQLAVNIRLELFDEHHPDYSSALNALALIVATMGETEEAIAMFEGLMRMRLESCGTVHPSFVIVQNNLASMLFLVNDLAKAGRVFTESLEMRERLSRLGTKEVRLAVLNLASVFSVQHRPADAQPFLSGAETIGKYLGLYPDL